MKPTQQVAAVEMARLEVRVRIASLQLRQIELSTRLGQVHPALLVGGGVAAGALVGRLVGVPKSSTLAAPFGIVASALQQRAFGMLRGWIEGLLATPTPEPSAKDQTRSS